MARPWPCSVAPSDPPRDPQPVQGLSPADGSSPDAVLPGTVCQSSIPGGARGHQLSSCPVPQSPDPRPGLHAERLWLLSLGVPSVQEGPPLPMRSFLAHCCPRSPRVGADAASPARSPHRPPRALRLQRDKVVTAGWPGGGGGAVPGAGVTTGKSLSVVACRPLTGREPTLWARTLCWGPGAHTSVLTGILVVSGQEFLLGLEAGPSSPKEAFTFVYGLCAFRGVLICTFADFKAI